MAKNANNILLSELTAATGYTDRIFHGLMDVSNLGHHPKLKELSQKLYFDVSCLFEAKVFLPCFINDVNNPPLTPRDIRQQIKAYTKFMEAILVVELKDETVAKTVTEFINILYTHAQQLHIFSNENTDLDIQYPRVNLLEMEELDDELIEVALFHLPLPKIESLLTDEGSSVDSLELQREKKYEALIQMGHEAIFQKDHKLALEKFSKALNYRPTAEALTLVGWSHSLMGNIEKAKSFCLKAIQKDPEYGPPYNDLGSYILGEGRIDESLKWFALAKKATNYQNREYPYINCGRAFLAKKEFNRALDEFSRALTLAPYHEELHDTVSRLKAYIDKSNSSSGDEPPPPVF